jgi:multidrug resistance efflux pump
MKKIFVIAGVVVLTVVLYIIFSKGGKDEFRHTSQQPEARIYVAAEGKVEVMPGFEVEVGSEIDGRIAEFFVKEGDEVKKGDLIARLGDSDIKAKVKEAEAELSVARSKLRETASGSREEEIKKAAADLEAAIAERDTAKAELERYEQLFKEGLAARSSLDDKERGVKVAEAKVKAAGEVKILLEKGPKEETLKLNEEAVKRAEAALEYYKAVFKKTLITAPISGKVIRKYLNSGEMISREMNISLIAVADINNIWINAEVDETDTAKITLGDAVEVRSDAYPGTVYKGEVAEISDYIGVRKVRPNNPAKNVDMKVIQVKIKLAEDTPLKPGMTVDVKIAPKG